MKLKIPQVIISLFLAAMALLAVVIKIPLTGLLHDSLVRLVMNGVLVLSLVPMLRAGVGVNYGLPVGVSAGLLGMALTLELRLTGMMGFLAALCLGMLIGTVFGYGYAKVLAQVKGKEEIAGIFIGYSFVFIMSLFWAVAPFHNPQMLWPIGGKGMRPTIGLKAYFAKVLTDLWVIKIGDFSLPLGMLLFFALLCFLAYLFFKTKLGLALSAVGENERFARLSGISVQRMRTLAIILSTVLAAAGICVYAQSYGFLELYEAPLMIAFPAASALFMGGSQGARITITQVAAGTFLFQAIYVFSGPLASQLLLPQISEIVRSIVTNGVILYALVYEGSRIKG